MALSRRETPWAPAMCPWLAIGHVRSGRPRSASIRTLSRGVHHTRGGTLKGQAGPAGPAGGAPQAAPREAAARFPRGEHLRH